MRGLYRNRSACNKGDNYSDSTAWEAGILRQNRAPSQKGQTNLPIGEYIPVWDAVGRGPDPCRPSSELAQRERPTIKSILCLPRNSSSHEWFVDLKRVKSGFKWQAAVAHAF